MYPRCPYLDRHLGPTVRLDSDRDRVRYRFGPGASPSHGSSWALSNRTSPSAAVSSECTSRVHVREERPCACWGLYRTSPLFALNTWCGRSGRRYITVVQPLDTLDLVVGYAAVALAVARDGQGRARIVAVRACESDDPGFLGWLAACAQRGATELHAHRLAETAHERATIAADLGRPVERRATASVTGTATDAASNRPARAS